MKIHLDTIMTGIEGKPLTNGGAPLDLKMALLISLMGTEEPQPQRDRSIESALKSRRLFQKIDTAKDAVLELKSDEILFLKKAAAETLKQFLAGAVILALEPEDEISA